MNPNTPAAMEKIYPEWRYRWCEAKTCYCMGCVNRGSSFPYQKEDWQEWVEKNPKSVPRETFTVFPQSVGKSVPRETLEDE